MTFRLYTTCKGGPLDHVEVRVRHVEPARAGIEGCLRARDPLTGSLVDDQRARLLEIADGCPISRALSAGAVIQTTLAAKAG